MRLKSKKILVTAAAQGIGRAIAIACAEEGAEVIATDINLEKLKKLGDLKNISIKQLDVTKRNEIEKLEEEIGRIDVLFNVAGYVKFCTILDCDEDTWDRTMNINVKSMYFMIKTFLPKMLAHGKGNIVNMASICSNKKGVPLRFVYATSKAAVVGLTKSVAADFCGKGIRCNCIMPGKIDTPGLRERMVIDNEIFEEVEASLPSGRIGKAEEVAKLAVYLASDESDYVNGTEMVIDGAFTV